MPCLLVFSGVRKLAVDFCESVSDSLPELPPGLAGLEVVLPDVLDVGEVVDDEAGRHHVALVDVLHEALDSCLLDELLLVEGALGGDEVASDPCDQQVREFVPLSGGRGTLLPVS